MTKVGPVFFEGIHSEGSDSVGKMISKRQGNHHASRAIRTRLFPLFLIGFGLLLTSRLFFLQIVQGAYFAKLADSNRIRTTPIHAPRGVIFDRNDKSLVYNVPGYREVVNGKTKQIDSSTALTLLAKGGSNLEIDSLRMYPCKDACAHVVGYVGQISPDELRDPLFTNYSATDIVGKMGIEQYYEPLLKGVDGAKLTEVDSMGKPVRTLGQTDPIPGQNITLTIDESLQQVVSRAMSNVKKGAAIVSKPDGEILAIFSAPSFDPNLFSMGGQVQQILTDTQNQPLLDRAISGTYPPGSTFKPIVAAAALQNNIIDSNFTVDDTGILKVGNFSFANWYYTDYGKTEGLMNVVGAIKRSNDIFFYKVGQMVGVDRLSGFAKFFGLGSPTGIDLPGEAAGLLPTRQWKEKVIGDKWYLGDDYHYGIGQGYLLTTPLQVNTWTQAIANEGNLYQPHLLLSQKPFLKESNLLTSQNASLIREGMIEVCQPGGVAWPLFNFKFQSSNFKYQMDGKDFWEIPDATNSGQMKTIGVSIACKTGTAQHGNDTTLPHSWITLFAPAYHPQIVVTVLAEDSGEGSNVAGPIAKDILTGYFEEK